MNFLGIDIGGTTVKCAIIDSDANILHKTKSNAYFDNYKTPLAETVKTSLKDIVGYCGEHNIEYSGIGFSVTGEIDTINHIVVSGCGSIPNWTGVNIKKLSQEVVGNNIPIATINDGNAVAIGEKWVGNAIEYNDFIVYTIGTGIGGGVYCDGKILQGKSGFAGNFGHFVIDSSSNRQCACGNFGCFEALCSTRSLLEQALNIGYDCSGEEIFILANKNPDLQEIVDKFFFYHGVAIGGLMNIFNPEAVLIGGGISNEGEWFIDRIKQEVFSKTMKSYSNNIVFSQAKLTNSAGVIGAVKHLINTNKF